MGLERLVGRDQPEYVALAAALSRDPERLAELRAGMRARMRSSPLTDGVRLTRFLESAYRRMWDDYCGARASAPHTEYRDT